MLAPPLIRNILNSVNEYYYSETWPSRSTFIYSNLKFNFRNRERKCDREIKTRKNNQSSNSTCDNQPVASWASVAETKNKRNTNTYDTIFYAVCCTVIFIYQTKI